MKRLIALLLVMVMIVGSTNYSFGDTTKTKATYDYDFTYSNYRPIVLNENIKVSSMIYSISQYSQKTPYLVIDYYLKVKDYFIWPMSNDLSELTILYYDNLNYDTEIIGIPRALLSEKEMEKEAALLSVDSKMVNYVDSDKIYNLNFKDALANDPKSVIGKTFLDPFSYTTYGEWKLKTIEAFNGDKFDSAYKLVVYENENFIDKKTVPYFPWKMINPTVEKLESQVAMIDNGSIDFEEKYELFVKKTLLIKKNKIAYDLQIGTNYYKKIDFTFDNYEKVRLNAEKLGLKLTFDSSAAKDYEFYASIEDGSGSVDFYGNSVDPNSYIRAELINKDKKKTYYYGEGNIRPIEVYGLVYNYYSDQYIMSKSTKLYDVTSKKSNLATPKNMEYGTFFIGYPSSGKNDSYKINEAMKKLDLLSDEQLKMAYGLKRTYVKVKDEPVKTLTLTINGKKSTFVNAPIEKNGVIYIPLIETSKLSKVYSATTTTHPIGGTFVVIHVAKADTMFRSFYQNSKSLDIVEYPFVAKTNKSVPSEQLKYSMIIENKQLYISVQDFNKVIKNTITYDATNKVIKVTVK